MKAILIVHKLLFIQRVVWRKGHKILLGWRRWAGEVTRAVVMARVEIAFAYLSGAPTQRKRAFLEAEFIADGYVVQFVYPFSQKVVILQQRANRRGCVS